ncbi:MAG TPA: ATP-binding protein [Devosiaceae bacterium]|nr:ATP-binding protein [Devosiaceae bacterium]
MAEDLSGRAPAAGLAVIRRLWGHRLAGRRAVLIATLLVLMILTAVGSLTWPEAGAAFVVIAVVALVAPVERDIENPVEDDEFSTGLGNEESLRIFADALADPCLILDHRSVIVHRNAAAAEQFRSATAGNPIAFSLRYPALLAAIDAARRTGISQTIELHQTVPNETWHKVVVAPLIERPLGDEDAAPLLLVTMQNLTEAKRIDALRADFIANASHELRTPLASLVGFIDTLLGPAARDPEARERFLTIMRSQAARMSKLIDDLLSLSRIEMRQHLRPTSAVDLGILLREVNEGLIGQAKDAQVTVTIEVPDGATMVTGDRDELYEVFENLLDNAIKYGADGGRIDVALAPVTNRSGYDFAVTVTDYGLGIEPEHVPRLTERFYRVDAESSRKKKGTGLGLAIVKHIVNRHRGLMTIRSRPGQGTRVEVLLPR